MDGSDGELFHGGSNRTNGLLVTVFFVVGRFLSVCISFSWMFLSLCTGLGHRQKRSRQACLIRACLKSSGFDREVLAEGRTGAFEVCPHRPCMLELRCSRLVHHWAPVALLVPLTPWSSSKLLNQYWDRLALPLFFSSQGCEAAEG